MPNFVGQFSGVLGPNKGSNFKIFPLRGLTVGKFNFFKIRGLTVGKLGWGDLGGRPLPCMAVTSKRIEIFWLLDQILKALIEAVRMVPLLRAYEAILKFEISTKKKHIEKKRILYMFFFG